MNTVQFQKKLLGMQGIMTNFALKLTSNASDAQDLVQETSLKVLDNQEKYTDNSNFAGWVFTVMHHIFVNNYHRLVQQQATIDQQADVYNLDVPDESSINMADSKVRLGELSAAVDKLPRPIKAVFSMYMSGYKYNEIAQRLDLPIGTVKSRIFFARTELQKAMEEDLNFGI
ncbi:MAG: RNA polymerase sigma factor [Tannerella sp.]|nr:RNA polymerase sigma factor [Tannerella sp.]